MLKIVDTHTHLFSREFDTDRSAVINRSIEAGVVRMYLPNIDVRTIGMMNNLADEFPLHCMPMLGLHPCSVKDDWQEQLKTIEEALPNRKYYGIGECGLDKHWDLTHIKEQSQALLIQTEWAKQYQLPIILHTRNATREAIDLIQSVKDQKLWGVFHCYGGTIEETNEILAMGDFYFGIGGVISFKNGGIDKIIEHIGLEKVVLETDSPYLAPVPHRGKRNESSYLKYVVEKLAEYSGYSPQEVARITTENANKLFRYEPANTDA